MAFSCLFAFLLSVEICFSKEGLLSISTTNNFTQFLELNQELLPGLYLEDKNLSFYCFS